MIRVVLFDFHNTLAVSDEWLDLEIRTLPAKVIGGLVKRTLIEEPPPGWEAEAAERFRALRQRVHASGVEVSAVDGVNEVLREMGLAAPHNEVEQLVEQLELAILPSIQPVAGVERALSELRNRGCRLGVVSSAGYPPFVELALESLGLRALFAEVVTSTGVGIYKSNPAIFTLAAQMLGARPEQAVHVGDHARFDVESARAAGLSTIWFAARARAQAKAHGQDWREIERIGSSADAVIMDMAELVRAVRRLG